MLQLLLLHGRGANLGIARPFFQTGKIANKSSVRHVAQLAFRKAGRSSARNAGRLGPKSGSVRSKRSNLAESGSNVVEAEPKPVGVRRIRAELGANSTSIGQVRPDTTKLARRFPPTKGRIGPLSTHRPRNWPRLARHRPVFA